MAIGEADDWVEAYGARRATLDDPTDRPRVAE